MLVFTALLLASVFQCWRAASVREIEHAIAPPECSEGTSKPFNEEQNNALSQFFRFVGVVPGATIKDVRRIYGDPERTGEDPRKWSYYNDAIEFIFHKETVARIELRNRQAPSAGAGIDEAMGKYLGGSAAEVMKDFGLPHKAHAGHLRYSFKSDGRFGDVSFLCYSFRDCVCTEIEVAWRSR